MELHQLSVFVENRPGQLNVPVAALSEAGINVLTLTLADTSQFGILRLIAADWEGAKAALEAADCVVNVARVVAVEVEHRPGGLHRLLTVLDQAAVNIEYMYAFTCQHGEQAVMVMRFDNHEAAAELLGQAGFRMVDDAELARRVAG